MLMSNTKHLLLHNSFDLRVFNTFVQSCRNTSLGQCYCRNELEKQRVYDGRVKGVEHGIFSPLVFSTTDGMWNTTAIVYKLIASLIADKQNKPYSKTLHKLRCRLSFRCSFQRSCAVEVVCAVGLWLYTAISCVMFGSMLALAACFYVTTQYWGNFIVTVMHIHFLFTFIGTYLTSSSLRCLLI